MKTIGTNSIRVYHVDPTNDHAGCMSAFSDAGIYLWLDLDTFATAIVQTQPKWTDSQREAFAAVMDEFQQFDNLAGFFIGNEVLTTSDGSVAAPYVKAAARDMKAYRDAKKYREIPIGYSAADIASLRPMLQNYLACGNASDALDFFSLNAYSWCGDSSYQTSGYSELEANSTDYSIPIFMSETGCNVVQPRTFQDQDAIFGEMADTWSGSIIYEWIEEANDYGLISYGPMVNPTSPSAPPDGYPRSGTPTPIQPGFSNLAGVWKTLNPTGVQESAYTPTNSAPECPAETSGVWEVNPTAPLPTLGQAYTGQADTTSASGSGASSPSSTASGSHTGSHSGTASGTASGSTTKATASSTGGASDGLSRELTGAGAALVAVMAVFAWL